MLEKDGLLSHIQSSSQLSVVSLPHFHTHSHLSNVTFQGSLSWPSHPNSCCPFVSDRSGSPRLFWAYVAQLGVRLVLEGAALGGQYHLYGFKMPSSFACRREPCLGSITCTVSRPSEKTIFLKTMFGVTGLCLLFTLLELVLLGLGRWWRTRKHKSPSSNYFPTSESTRRHKEPTDKFLVVETKEQFREAGEKGTHIPLSSCP